MGILICIIAFLGYLQYGHEEQAVNTIVSTSDAFYKLFNLDKEKYAEELIEKAVENKYRNVRFSYDITGYPNEITISVYSNEWSYEHNQRMYQIIYSSDNDGNNVKNNADKFKIQIYEK